MKKNVQATNKKTGEKFYGEDPFKLMSQLSKKYPGKRFDLKTLDPHIRFLMK